MRKCLFFILILVLVSKNRKEMPEVAWKIAYLKNFLKNVEKVLRGKEKTSNGKDYLFSSRATNSSINAIDSLIMSSQ